MFWKKSFTKVILFVILLALTIGFIGCGQADVKDPDTGDETGKTDEKPDDKKDDDKKEPEVVEDEDPVEISVWIAVGRYTKEDRQDAIDYEQDFGYIEDKLNIKLKYVEVPDEEKYEQVGIMLATNELTDIMATGSGFDTFVVRPDQMFTDGQIIDLRTVREYMPNYFKFVDENPVIQKNVMDDDGNVLWVGTLISYVEQGMGGGLMVRKDWLDKFDVELPETMDEYVEALKLFREGDPNENGEIDEIPFCGNQGSLQVIGNLTGIQETFSMDGGPAGEVIFAPLHEERYKKRLKLMRTFVQEKLINENYYNFDFAMRDTWMAEDRVGGALTGSGNMDKWNEMMRDHPTFLMWAVTNPEQEDGNRYYDEMDLSMTMGHSPTVISTKAERPDKAAELVDFFFSEEGSMFANFGVEGVTYEMKDGFPKYTELITHNDEGLSIGNARGKYIGIPGFQTYEDPRVWAQNSLNSPASRQGNMRIWVDDFTIETNTPVPSALMDEDDADEYSDIMADLQTYVLESVAKFTTGDWDIDADYEQFAEQCKVLGAERALEIRQKAVKAWQDRGVPFEYTLGRIEVDYWDQIPLVTEKGIEMLDSDLQ